MSEHGHKEHVLAKLKRSHGLNEEALKAMHSAVEKLPHWVRCWKCRKQNTGTLIELQTAHCKHCGVKLWTRDDDGN